MNNIRMGIIGCGYWGPNLVRNFVALPNVEVVGAADKEPDRLNHIQSLYPHIEVTQNYRDLFAMGLDAVVVATPPATHYEIGKECLENNLHAFIEKPMTLKSRDAELLIELAHMRDLTLMVGHTFEYNPAVRKVREIIQSGELGKVYYITTDRLNLGLFQADMNVMWDLAPHDISILMYILGLQPEQVSAKGGTCIFKDKHDIAFMYLEFPENIVAHIHVSWLDPCKIRRITVVGSKKMLVYDDVESLEKIRIYDKGVDKLPYTDTFGDFNCSYRYGNVVIPYIKFTEPLRIECQHFIECVMDNSKTPQSSGYVGLNVVRVLEAAQRSIENGGRSEEIDDRVIRGDRLVYATTD